MKKFTKLFMAFALCMVALVANAKTEKVYATFENPTNTSTTWDSATKTFTWNATSYNQLRNIGLPNGDISKYKKLVVDCDIVSGEKFRILFYKSGSNLTLWVTKSGVNEFIIADTLKSIAPDDYNEYMLACDEICLSGSNQIAPGEVKINEVYLETYDDEGEKTYATFENPTNTSTTWDAATKTFTWNATSYNQLRNIGLPNGDISKYKKLVVDCDIVSGEKFRILFYKGGSNLTLWATKSGVNEFIIADTLKSIAPNDYNEYILACDEICLSGNNVVAPGEVKINSVYLETYPENESVDIPEVEEEVLPEHYSKLTDIMFKAWDDPVNPTTSKGAGCAYVLKESTGLPYGDVNVYYLNYADLTGYDKLEVTVSEGTPRFCFNRLVDQGATSENEEESKLIDIPNTKWATERYQTVEGNVYTINLQLMTEEKGYARLNCIKGANWANVTVTSMYLIKENERIEISESGLATFACEYALDFTTATKVAAYKAAVSNGVVNLTKVGKVAAGEGVLVRSVGGGSVAESIPYAEGEVSANDGNAFIGNLRTISSQASEDENYKYYILGYTEANGYGFYLANNKTIASGKAYLKVSKTDESSAKATFFSLDGETTGIVNVETVAPISEANIYDLSGRIVKNPVKGLYIINGKKYIVK